ncbi:unnamed protein product, partial [Coregonus sp. 'balchen']
MYDEDDVLSYDEDDVLMYDEDDVLMYDEDDVLRVIHLPIFVSTMTFKGEKWSAEDPNGALLFLKHFRKPHLYSYSVALTTTVDNTSHTLMLFHRPDNYRRQY